VTKAANLVENGENGEIHHQQSIGRRQGSYLLGAAWKSSGRFGGIVRKFPKENGAKYPDFLEVRRF
jgi:hypothetical protein